ncbi:MAG: glycogen synthase GlgA [Deltaproteobacteria bacterium]|nr:glycogen synthase GlgA [Deltaproteobacteria bacterium]
MEERMTVFFLTPEAVPFAKTGGLADVAGSLPNALKRSGVDVKMAMPYYRPVREGDFDVRTVIKDLGIRLGAETYRLDVLECRLEEGIAVYFIDREDLYDRPNLYGDGRGDYYDNFERFAFFSLAALNLPERLAFRPDVIHCHDWQTGLIPAMVKGSANHRSYRGIPVVFTIHNLAYQGIFPEEKLALTGLPNADFFQPEGLEYWGKISLLKAGIVYSEAVTTVSPAYAREIRTPEYGMGMEGILQKRQAVLHGILNGVDYHLWDPERDPHIPAQYSIRKIKGKGDCKAALLDEMGLGPRMRDRPLLAVVSRLDVQKGLDLLVKILDDMMSTDIGLVILGAGDEGIQKSLLRSAEKYAGRIGLRIGFDEPLAHRIMAGADIFLIPSRYEPCGLTQMYALKYGIVPVVRSTGGLEDTVEQFDSKTKKGNGFKFTVYEPGAFLEAVREAVRIYREPEVWSRLMANGMNADFSWDRSARRYKALYQSILTNKGKGGPGKK